MKYLVVLLIAILFIFGLPLLSQEKQSTSDKNATYLVETRHTKEQCLEALDAVNNKDKKLLNKINWGCAEGNHTGYMMVEAKSEKEALKELPDESKTDIKVYKLSKFTPEQIANFHK